jgi:hypothetical protein
LCNAINVPKRIKLPCVKIDGITMKNYKPPDPSTCPPEYEDPYIICEECDKVFIETDPGVEDINIKIMYCPHCIGIAYIENPTLLQPYLDELKGKPGIDRKRYYFLLNEIQKMIDVCNNDK